MPPRAEKYRLKYQITDHIAKETFKKSHENSHSRPRRDSHSLLRQRLV